MSDQVITIREDGSVAGLQRKDGLDLTTLGEADIQRASEVIWDKAKQKWFVEFRSAKEETGFTHVNLHMLSCAYEGTIIENLEAFREFCNSREPMLFSTYEEGVKAEIACLDYLRLHGVLK